MLGRWIGPWEGWDVVKGVVCVMAQVITVFQFLQALMLVACVVPRGLRTSEKALLLVATAWLDIVCKAGECVLKVVTEVIQGGGRSCGGDSFSMRRVVV